MPPRAPRRPYNNGNHSSHTHPNRSGEQSRDDGGGEEGGKDDELMNLVRGGTEGRFKRVGDFKKELEAQRLRKRAERCTRTCPHVEVLHRILGLLGAVRKERKDRKV